MLFMALYLFVSLKNDTFIGALIFSDFRLFMITQAGTSLCHLNDRESFFCHVKSDIKEGICLSIAEIGDPRILQTIASGVIFYSFIADARDFPSPKLQSSLLSKRHGGFIL
jgi:hypothetical protein